MSLVLNTGAYPPLLETRRLVLENAGHFVITSVEESGIALACQGYPFDVAVIGQSAPAYLKRRIFHLVRKHCGTARILELITTDSGRALEAADAWLEVQPMQAHLFAQRVSELARR
jgi:hypothetical protein